MEMSIGKKYDKIAQWWHQHHFLSNYGIPQIERAINFTNIRNSALDIGCGSGGRIIRKLLLEGFNITAIDASIEMINIGKSIHNNVEFIHADILDWKSEKKFDLIIAWDSIFHIPMHKHESLLYKLSNLLTQNGILIYSFGNDFGEHVSDWHGEKFPYASIGINQNISKIMESGCQILHLELDQYPEKHVYMIAKKCNMKIA